MSAQIIPFPIKQPPAPERSSRDRRDAEFVRLIREACDLQLAGIERPDWDAYVAERLDRAYSE